VKASSAQAARVEAASLLTLEEVAAFKAARDRMPPCDQGKWRQWLGF